ncbi:VOC family protein [Corallococcus llansteffanensis]|uniref:VOC family protein n=1 Tax=Corallococcus llansteffanensis TaxID=2316731 RepID=A0A3A8NVL5_9BACT|nr:VOC family protein [Corallococcus llansteffanensis]RKH48133.1 VOC family protein [Corallococcus llansteffanensis]
MDKPQTMRSFVKLLVTDTPASVRFYEGLGFERIASGPPILRLQWGGESDMYLISSPAGLKLEGRKGLGVLVGFRAGEAGVDAVAQKALALGAPVEGPTVQPWYTREIIVTDPDGYRLNFIEPS